MAVARLFAEVEPQADTLALQLRNIGLDRRIVRVKRVPHQVDVVAAPDARAGHERRQVSYGVVEKDDGFQLWQAS